MWALKLPLKIVITSYWRSQCWGTGRCVKPLETHSILCIFSLNNIVCVKAVSKLKSIIYVRYIYDLSYFLLICHRFFGSFLCHPCYYFSCSSTSLVFCILISAFLPFEGCLMIWIISGNLHVRSFRNEATYIFIMTQISKIAMYVLNLGWES